jgi:hypothetical protein
MLWQEVKWTGPSDGGGRRSVWDSGSWSGPAGDGLYDPANEREACGVGFVVHIDGVRSNKVRISFSNLLLMFQLFK